MALPLMDPGDILAVTLKGRLFGQRTNNTFHYYVPTVAAGQTFTEFFSQWNVDFETLWSNFVSEDWTGDIVTIRRLGANATRGIDFGIDWVGQVASPSLPPSTAAVISRWTYGPGPKSRGRIFIAGVPTSAHLEGELTNAAMALLTILAEQIDDEVTDPGDFAAEPVLLNRPTLTVQTLDGVTARSILRQQRRREIGVGE